MECISKIVVQSGNLIDMEDQIRLVSQSSFDELKGCIKSALNETPPRPCADAAPGGQLVVKGKRKPLMYSDRGVSTTAKVFLSDYNAEHVTEALRTVCDNIGRSGIETVILAPPDVSCDAGLEELMEVWRAMEAAYDNCLVRHLGVADVSCALFKRLHEWARVKPCTIQVNVDECCSVSEELKEFARQNDVQLLTHSDSHEMLDEDLVSSILTRCGAASSPCAVPWVARHRSINTCFGVVLDKGYTIKLDLKHQAKC